MDHFNRDTYKQETLFQSFYHSCLGKIIIIAAIMLILFVSAVMTRPSDEAVLKGADENVQECIQDNDSIKNDELDEFFANVARSFSETDTMLTNQEALKYFHRYNKLEIYNHTAYTTCYLRNTLHPQGIRVGIGLFGLVISTINYEDMILDLAPARGEFNVRISPAPTTTDTFSYGENPHLKPYHYNGNPDD
jgi:uncharacterized protein YpuA (DUF1002 family)